MTTRGQGHDHLSDQNQQPHFVNLRQKSCFTFVCTNTHVGICKYRQIVFWMTIVRVQRIASNEDAQLLTPDEHQQQHGSTILAWSRKFTLNHKKLACLELKWSFSSLYHLLRFEIMWSYANGCRRRRRQSLWSKSRRWPTSKASKSVESRWSWTSPFLIGPPPHRKI